MSPILRTVILLTLSNVFMTFAWYAHLKNLGSSGKTGVRACYRLTEVSDGIRGHHGHARGLAGV